MAVFRFTKKIKSYTFTRNQFLPAVWTHCQRRRRPYISMSVAEAAARCPLFGIQSLPTLCLNSHCSFLPIGMIHQRFDGKKSLCIFRICVFWEFLCVCVRLCGTTLLIKLFRQTRPVQSIHSAAHIESQIKKKRNINKQNHIEIFKSNHEKQK